MAILSKGQKQHLPEFVANSEMQLQVAQIVRHRTKLKPAEAMEFGKITAYSKKYGEMDTVGLILLLVLDFNNSFAIENRLSDNDCGECAHKIYREYPFLAMAELAVLLENAKYGTYGKVYGSGATQRIGKDTFWQMIETYMDERKEIVQRKKQTSMEKYDEQWVLTEGEMSKGVNCPPEVLEAIKSIGSTNRPGQTEEIKVSEESRDAKNKLIQIQELRTWFPKELNRLYHVAEYRFDRWGKPCTVDYILESRQARNLKARIHQLKNPNRYA